MLAGAISWGFKSPSPHHSSYRHTGRREVALRVFCVVVPSLTILDLRVQSKAATVAGDLAELAPDRRAAISKARATINSAIRPWMWWARPSIKCRRPLQCIPARFKLVPIATLRLASTTPVVFSGHWGTESLKSCWATRRADRRLLRDVGLSK